MVWLLLRPLLNFVIGSALSPTGRDGVSPGAKLGANRRPLSSMAPTRTGRREVKLGRRPEPPTQLALLKTKRQPASRDR